MQDFAAAAMMRLIERGMRRQGLLAGQDEDERVSRLDGKAHVPLVEKRQLADSLFRQFGPLVLLRMGEAIDDAADEPILMTALARARDPVDLVARWQRLERFSHSRHRTRVLAQAERAMTLRHIALSGYPNPRPAEDLLVFGLLTALLDRYAAVDLKARPVGEHKWCFHGGSWRAEPARVDTATWQYSWRSVGANAINEHPIHSDEGWSVAATRLLEHDPGREWTIARLATDMHVSIRTLQRRFRAEKTSFSALLTTVRLSAGARLLLQPDLALAEIGYACGFADQAHFTRDFKKQVGTTPGRFRSDFRD